MNGITFTAVPNHHQFFCVSGGSDEQKESLKKSLTVTNYSVIYEIKRIKEDLASYSAKPNEFALKMIPKLKDRLRSLVCHEEERFYYENEQGELFIPAGYWDLAGSVEGNAHLNTEIKPFLVPGLRPYQEEAVPEILKYKRATCVLGTGLGKTRVISSITMSAVKAGKRVMIVVPSEYLVKQVSEIIKEYHSSVTTASGKRNPRLGCDVMVTTVGTAKKYIDAYDVIAIDECIPYDQCVLTEDGPMKIGALYKMWESRDPNLPRVLSFNQGKNSFQYKEITHAWKRSPEGKRILEIKTSRLRLKATENHPFLVQDKGWVEAKDLQVGDIMIGPYHQGGKQDLGAKAISQHQKDIFVGSYLGDGGIHSIGPNRFRISFIHGEAQYEYLAWKLSMFGIKPEQIRYIEKNGYSQKPAYSCATKCFDMKLDLSTDGKQHCNQWFIDNLTARSLAIWVMDDGSMSTNNAITLSVCAFDLESCERLSRKLQTDFGIENYIRTCKKGCNYIVLKREATFQLMKIIAPYIHTSMVYKSIFPEQADLNQWSDNFLEHATYPVTEINEYDYSSRKTSLGYGLFDLEVQGNHNFVLSASGDSKCGVVVHNCHHSSAATWADLLSSASKAEYVYGLTATPFRSDGMDLGIHAFVGPTVFERSCKWGIENKWLSEFSVYLYNIAPWTVEGYKIKLHDKTRKVTAYKKLSINPCVINDVAKTIAHAAKADRKIMVIFTSLPALHLLRKALKKDYQINTDVADADFKKPLTDFAASSTTILLATSRLISEGVDIPTADTLIVCTQHSSDLTTYQSVGRILRLSKDKKPPMVIDFTIEGYDGFFSAKHKRLQVYQEIASLVVNKNKDFEKKQVSKHRRPKYLLDLEGE